MAVQRVHVNMSGPDCEALITGPYDLAVAKAPTAWLSTQARSPPSEPSRGTLRPVAPTRPAVRDQILQACAEAGFAPASRLETREMSAARTPSPPARSFLTSPSPTNTCWLTTTTARPPEPAPSLPLRSDAHESSTLATDHGRPTLLSSACRRGGGWPRVQWHQVPAVVRTGIEDQLGSTVVSAQSQPGGFSPGSADRVVLADGRRAFVKAVGHGGEPDSPPIHRRENSR